MRYVEYELNLESLRAMRTKRIRSGQKKKNGVTMSDTCCVRLIRWIFDRAVMKFPGDVDLWLHYIDFVARQGQVKVRVCWWGSVLVLSFVVVDVIVCVVLLWY